MLRDFYDAYPRVILSVYRVTAVNVRPMSEFLKSFVFDNLRK